MRWIGLLMFLVLNPKVSFEKNLLCRRVHEVIKPAIEIEDPQAHKLIELFYIGYGKGFLNAFPQTAEDEVEGGEYFEDRLKGQIIAMRFKKFLEDNGLLQNYESQKINAEIFEKESDEVKKAIKEVTEKNKLENLTLKDCLDSLENILNESSLSTNELLALDPLVKAVNTFITEEAKTKDKIKGFIQQIGKEFGYALGFYLYRIVKRLQDAGVEDDSLRELVQNIVLVGGVSEYLGKGIKDKKGKDILVKAIEEGAREVLRNCEDENLVNSVNIKRTEMQGDRDFYGFPPEDKDKVNVVIRAQGTSFGAGVVGWQDNQVKIFSKKTQFWREYLGHLVQQKNLNMNNSKAVRNALIALMKQLVNKALEKVSKSLSDVEKIIVSWAGPGKYWEGSVMAPNIDSFQKETLEKDNYENGFPLKEVLANRFGVSLDQIKIVHDGIGAVRGETSAGTLKNKQNALAIIWGTGIGAGVLINGKTYYDYFSGERRDKLGPLGEIGHHIVFIDTFKYLEGVKEFGGWNKNKCKVVVWEVDPQKIGVTIMIDEKHNDTFFANRVEDKVIIKGSQNQDIFYMNKLREEMPKISDYKNQFENTNKNAEVIGVVPISNVLWNKGYVAWINGELYHWYGEKVFGEVYPSLIMWKDKTVSIENVEFKNEKGIVRVYNKTGEITDKIEWFISGDYILKNGDNNVLNASEKWGDLRHLLTFPTVEIEINGQKTKRYFGLPYLYNHRDKLRKALEGEVIEIPVKDEWLEGLSIEEIEKRLTEDAYYKKYESYKYKLAENENTIREGELFVTKTKEGGKVVKIRFKKGVYPHTVVGITKEKKLMIVQVQGLSREKGATMDELVNYLKELGIKDALIMCNGGDVVTYYKDEIMGQSEATIKGRAGFSGVLLIYKTRR